jgi:micrococcal nuclease
MYTYNAKLDRVIDGDTVDALVDLGFDTWKKVRIRLVAKQRVIDVLNENNNEFTLKSHGVGKYGRCLGEIFVKTLGETSLQKTLVVEGHAVEYDGGKR